jgi:hypothetical protein
MTGKPSPRDMPPGILGAPMSVNPHGAAPTRPSTIAIHPTNSGVVGVLGGKQTIDTGISKIVMAELPKINPEIRQRVLDFVERKK